MSSSELRDFLKSENLILVDKNAFLDFMIDVNIKTQVDVRVKWIDRKTAIQKYNVTNYWLLCAEKDIQSKLRVNVGKTKTATKKYNEKSIIDELERQATYS